MTAINVQKEREKERDVLQADFTAQQAEHAITVARLQAEKGRASGVARKSSTTGQRHSGLPNPIPSYPEQVGERIKRALAWDERNAVAAEPTAISMMHGGCTRRQMSSAIGFIMWNKLVRLGDRRPRKNIQQSVRAHRLPCLHPRDQPRTHPIRLPRV